ncbi:MAG: carbon-nitrogen hydrolase family protein, partial [bacterium]|nr:carbon-nitrogen hydrolase family protein [bacterium]
MDTKFKIIKVAVVQDSPVFLNKEATIEKVCQKIESAAASGAELVLFPEAFVSGYPDWVWVLPAGQKKQINDLYQQMFESALSEEDPALKEIGACIKKAGVYVVIGANERNSEASNSSLCNSMFYFDRQGKLLGVHRKLIPTGGERLMWAQGGADRLLSYKTELGRIGGLICWENFMPLARNVMYVNGV